MLRSLSERQTLYPKLKHFFWLGFFLLLLINLLPQRSYSQGNAQDSLKSLLSEYTSSDKYRFELLIEYALQNEQGSAVDMLDAAQEALYIAQQLDRADLEAKATWIVGYALFMNGKIRESYERFNLIENRFSEYLKEDLLANTKFGKAKVYESFGKFTDALENYLLSLQAFESAKLARRTADVKHNIGRLYAINGNNNEALRYYEDAIKAYDQLGSLRRMAYICVDKADLVKSMGRMDEAIIGYRDAIGVFEKLGFDVGLIQAHTNLASVYIELGELEKAENELMNAGSHYNQQNTILGIPIYKTYAILFESRSEWNRALDAWLQVLMWAEQEQQLNSISEALRAIGKNYERQGSYQLALNYIQKYQVIQDSLNILNRQSDLESVQTKHALELTEKENMLLSNKAELEKQKAYRTFILTLALAVVVFMLIVFSYFIVKALRKQRLQSNALLHLNTQLEQANQEVVSMNQSLELRVAERTNELATRNEQLEKYAFKHSHELRAPLSRLMGLIELLKMEEDDVFKDGQTVIIDGIGTSAEQLDQIVRSMAKELEMI